MLAPKISDHLRQQVRQDFLAGLSQSHLSLGEVFRLALGKHDLYFVAHPELAKEVLITQKENFAKVGASGATTGLQMVLGEGLLTVTNTEHWRKTRRIMQPLFHQQTVSTWTECITNATQRLLMRLREKGQSDIAREMLETTAEILYQIIFSLSPQEAKKFPLIFSLSLSTSRRKVIREAMQTIEPVISSLLKERKTQRGQHQDILEFLLEAQDEDPAMTDKKVQDELLTLFAAGHETTSYALAWNFYLLSQHSQIYQDLITRARHTTEDLMLYATAVFKESLRLYPTIPSAPRVALQTTRLGGFEIPKGARVFVSFYLIHRHQDFWHQPEQFRPERFLSKDPEAFMPFGLGQRYCLGKNLAMLQGPLVLAHLSKQLRLELSPRADISPKVVISLFPKYGIPMKALDS